MKDAHLADLAGRQFNRVSRAQLFALGFSERAVEHRVAAGRLVIVEQGVFAVAPALDDDWGLWMGATLTEPHTFLSHVSVLAARGLWSLPRQFETVSRPGTGGPRRHGGLLVHRSETLAGECEMVRGVPMIKVPRTIIDVAPRISDRALARLVRESIRLDKTTIVALGDALGRYRGRRGTRRLADALARYKDLPIKRARSGAEIRALEVLRDSCRPLPALNRRIAAEEADLSWAKEKLIIEIDGGPFHLDIGEDARKEAAWKAAGWQVLRLSSDDVYEQPHRLLELAPAPNVPRATP